MADGNKPNHLCFKWGSNSGETANWHVPHNKVKSQNKIFLWILVPNVVVQNTNLCWGILFLLLLFFLASEESLSLVLIHFFSVQFQKFKPPTGLNLA